MLFCITHEQRVKKDHRLPNLIISFIRGFKLEKKQAYLKKKEDKKIPSVKVTKLFKYTVNNEARNKHGH